MKPQTTWSHTQYRPAVHGDDEIYICQVIPGERELTLCRKSREPALRLYWREKGSEADWSVQEVSGERAQLRGLAVGVDYEFYLQGEKTHSAVGYAKTSFVPGTVVNYLHPEDPKYAFSGQHLCSPSLLKHPDGYLLISMDLYEGRAPQNLTLIFRSDDGGESWYHYSELMPCYWGTLFLHRGDVYMLSTSTEYGDLLIGRSPDGGKSFGAPTVLFRGAGHYATPGWHKGAMPVIEHKGRLWCGIDFGSHASGGHASCLLSADIDADLLAPDAWSLTEPLVYDPAWTGAVVGDRRGFLEGNAVVLPNGEIGNFLRYCTDKGAPRYGLAPILRGDVSAPEKALVFDRFVPFPGNLSKFEMHRDEKDGRYYAIVSKITDPQNPTARNVLSLIASFDLENWEVLLDLQDYSALDPKVTGFQYVSFQFDGADIIYACRTAFNGAQSYHDNNYVTFHRIQNYGQIKNKASQNARL